MIVVSELSRDLIERVLWHLESNGELLQHTRPLTVSGRSDAAAG
jgi:hypothetical protein